MWVKLGIEVYRCLEEYHVPDVADAVIAAVHVHIGDAVHILVVAADVVVVLRVCRRAWILRENIRRR